jgi:hypothetical integral membrane protein (TIGR02206 family)
MEQFFTKDYTGAPFQLFGPMHLAILGIIALIGFSFIFARKLWSEQTKVTFRYGLAIWLVVWELGWHIWSIYYGLWTIQTNLPLHLCSIFVWLSVIMLLKKNSTIFELAYFLGIGGATQALLTPDAGIYGLPHFRAVQTLAAHGGIVLAALYMTIVEGFRPTWASFKRVFLWTNIYMVIIFFLNLALGSNYLFIAHVPEFPSLIDLLAPWPWYILELEVIALVICFVLYLPFMIKDWAAGREAVSA